MHAYNPYTRDAEAGGSLPVQTGLDYQTAQFKRERERVNQGPIITWREGLAIALSFNRALAGLGLTCYTGVQEGQGKRLVHSDGSGGTGSLHQAQLDGCHLHTFLVGLDSPEKAS